MNKDFGASALQRMYELEKNGTVLSMTHKLLLAETGTVEQMLSIIIGSPIRVDVMKQSEEKDILKREAILRSESGESLIRARSRVYCRNLPAAVVKKIRRRNVGIGTVIFDANLETFRKVTKIGMKEGIPHRTYRIFYRGKVAFEIREELLLKGGPGGI